LAVGVFTAVWFVAGTEIPQHAKGTDRIIVVN
jgi:hypothetical protein